MRSILSHLHTPNTKFNSQGYFEFHWGPIISIETKFKVSPRVKEFTERKHWHIASWSASPVSFEGVCCAYERHPKSVCSGHAVGHSGDAVGRSGAVWRFRHSGSPFVLKVSPRVKLFRFVRPGLTTCCAIMLCCPTTNSPAGQK